MDYKRYQLHSRFSNGNMIYEDTLDSGCTGVTASYAEIPFPGVEDFSVVGDNIYLYYDNMTKLLDMNFNIIIQGNYSDIVGFVFDDKDLFIACNNESLYGIVRSSGEVVLPFKYFEINRQLDKVYLRDEKGSRLETLNF